MNKARYLVDAHLLEGRSVAELAATHGVHRGWIYKLLARLGAAGYAALEPRNRRPRSCPHQTSTSVAQRIVSLRKELCAQGLDDGAQTIAYHLKGGFDNAPSVATIWRILRREGLVEPEPNKRPYSSFVRFEADLPN